jgi:hypothetical protein
VAAPILSEDEVTARKALEVGGGAGRRHGTGPPRSPAASGSNRRLARP